MHIDCLNNFLARLAASLIGRRSENLAAATVIGYLPGKLGLAAILIDQCFEGLIAIAIDSQTEERCSVAIPIDRWSEKLAAAIAIGSRVLIAMFVEQVPTSIGLAQTFVLDWCPCNGSCWLSTEEKNLGGRR